MNCSTTELIVRYSYCSARVRYSLRRPDDYIAGIHDATGSPTLPGQLSQVWACTSQIVTVTKTDNGSLATGFDIYRRGAAADHPEPGTGGSLAARPLQPPAHHWTRSPNHPITKSLVPILAMGSTGRHANRFSGRHRTGQRRDLSVYTFMKLLSRDSTTTS